MPNHNLIVYYVEKRINEKGFKLTNKDRLEIQKQYIAYGNVFVEFTYKSFRLCTDKEVLKLLEE